MTPAYDIGVGRCSEIEGDMVYVRLDALIAKRLAPGAPWNRSGTSVLRCNRKFCSERRPPVISEEVYLDAATLVREAPGEIDVLGSGNFRPVDLRIILNTMTPLLAAPAPHEKWTSRRGK